MPKGKNGESCNEAVRAVISTDEVVSFAELFGRVRERGNWTDSTIYQHLMSLVVNLPPARHHWKNSKPFLFLHADGRYELYKVTGYESLREKVLETLEARANGLCDECIKVSSGVSDKDILGRIIKTLVNANRLQTFEGNCANCHTDRRLLKLKLVSPIEMDSSQKSSLTRDEVIEIHLKAAAILDRFEFTTIHGEGFSSRVIRLREANILPGNVACMLLTINGLRNMVVHERLIIGSHEAAVIRNAMAVIRAWASANDNGRTGSDQSNSLISDSNSAKIS